MFSAEMLFCIKLTDQHMYHHAFPNDVIIPAAKNSAHHRQYDHCLFDKKIITETKISHKTKAAPMGAAFVTVLFCFLQIENLRFRRFQNIGNKTVEHGCHFAASCAVQRFQAIAVTGDHACFVQCRQRHPAVCRNLIHIDIC